MIVKVPQSTTSNVILLELIQLGILTSVASTFDASPTDRIWEFAVSKHPNPTMPADIASIQISKSGTTFTGHIITVLVCSIFVLCV